MSCVFENKVENDVPARYAVRVPVIQIAGKKLAVYYLPVIYYTKSGVEGVLAVTAFVILTVIPLIIEITGDVQYKRRSSYNER